MLTVNQLAGFGAGGVAAPPYDAGTGSQPISGQRGWGDGLSGRRHAGMRFITTLAGGVTSASAIFTTVGVPFNAVARIYTDNAGSPGTQVGTDSDTKTTTASTTETWAFSSPVSLSASTGYWIVLSDTSGGSGDANMRIWADSANTNPSGVADTITSISDHSGSIPAGGEGWRIEVIITPI